VQPGGNARLHVGVTLAESGGMVRIAALALASVAIACGDAPATCETERLPFRSELHCEAELEAEAARPLDASLPGALTVKTIIDRAHDNSVTFQDTNAYAVHSKFAIEHLGWPPGQPFLDQYVSPGRRFLLGSITWYQEADVFAYELAPYDTATPEMIELAFKELAGATYFGKRLKFHPTSEEQLARAAQLPKSVPVITTDELFAGISYQPLNLGETYARVHVLNAADLQTTYVGPREIAVLDRVPNDISVVAGVVTQELQTPLSHVNVLAQQRGTPNMGLRDAHAKLAAYDGKWVRLTVRAFDWEVAAVTAEEADAWWQLHRPPPAVIPEPDYSAKDIFDIDDVGVGDVPRVGGKAANYGALRDIGSAVRVRHALAIPVVFYRDFLVANAFDTRIATMLADPAFKSDVATRKQMLAQLQTDIKAAPVPAAMLATIEARLDHDFPATRLKFRSSTNAEDLMRYSGAGLYDSKAGQVGDPTDPVDAAIKVVWASVWNFRAFEEREYASIDHTHVAMAVLVAPSFGDELANGVAITANVFDPAPGGEDALFVNAQVGETSIVSPPPGVVADSLMYYFFHLGQPATYYTRSSLTGGTSVLARSELFDLGEQLAAIRDHFSSLYPTPPGYGQLPMDVEWKLVDDGGGVHHIYIKQARPYPGRGQ
jgi:pyruvate,water dikinase